MPYDEYDGALDYDYHDYHDGGGMIASAGHMHAGGEGEEHDHDHGEDEEWIDVTNNTENIERAV